MISISNRKSVSMATSIVVTAFLLIAIAGPSGCVAPQKKDTPQTANSPVKLDEPVEESADKTKEDQSKPQKQETLAAVEEFLARTQDYRRPTGAESKGASTSPAPKPVADGPQRDPVGEQAPVAVVAPETAMANTQVAISEPSPQPLQPVPAVESISIKPAQARNESKSSRQASKSANATMETQAARVHLASESLVAEFRAELDERKDAASEWKLRMLLLALGRSNEAVSVRDTGPPEMAGVLPALCNAADAVREALRNPAGEAGLAMEKVSELRDRMSANLGPVVSNIAMCRKVTTFGNYDEMAAEDFVAGRSIQTIVYAEIDNLRASPTGSSGYETRLSTRIEVWSADGKSMWQREEPDVTDRCRRARRDFFVAQRITLPPTLPEGEYVLRVTVEDKSSRLIGDGSVNLRLASPISVAKRE